MEKIVKSYRLTDFGKSFISGGWDLNMDLVKNAGLFFKDLPENESI